MPVNKFKLKAALKAIDDQGIALGDLITVTWHIDAQFGGGTRSHTGVLKVLDRDTGWFELNPSGSSPGHLRSTLLASSLTATKASLSRVEEESGTTDSETATDNPFVAKARKAAMTKKPTKRTASENAAMPKVNPFIRKAKTS